MRLPPPWLAYVPALIVLVLAVLFLVLRARGETTARAVNHSHEVITEVDRLLLALTFAESRHRGYLISGDSAYLAPSREATEEAISRLERVRHLVADKPAPAVRLTHPDRLYWKDAGVTKSGLADYCSEVWPRIAPFIVWNASVRKDITRDVSLSFLVTNVFNNHHPRDDTFYTYPFFWRAYDAVGREAFAQVDFRF